jgi:hypothetical protein
MDREVEWIMSGKRQRGGGDNEWEWTEKWKE